MPVKLRTRRHKDSIGFFLDIHQNGRRWTEKLDVRIFDNDTNKRTKKSEVETIRRERESQIASGIEYNPYKRLSENFNDYMDKRINASKSKINSFKAMKKKWIMFIGKQYIAFSEITPSLCRDFRKSLNDNLTGETPHDYFKIFKQIIKDAINDGYFLKNPCDGVSNPNPVKGELRKDVLFDDEIALLAVTPIHNLEVRRAFLFACMTGLRWADIVKLKWSDVDIKLRCVKIKEQAKRHNSLIVPLNDNAISLLGFIRDKSTPVFNLPSQTAVNKSLKKWAIRAGLNKHVTFHVARHSLITNILKHTGNLKLAGSIAGHATTRHTEKYAHIVQTQKSDAVNLLPNINVL